MGLVKVVNFQSVFWLFSSMRRNFEENYEIMVVLIVMSVQQKYEMASPNIERRSLQKLLSQMYRFRLLLIIC